MKGTFMAATVADTGLNTSDLITQLVNNKTRKGTYIAYSDFRDYSRGVFWGLMHRMTRLGLVERDNSSLNEEGCRRFKLLQGINKRTAKKFFGITL